MWQIDRPTEPICGWLDFEPADVLYEFDFPMIFTCRDRTGGLFLAYFCARGRDAIRFLVVPFSDDLVRQLRAGEINVRDSLTQPRMWVFDLDRNWEPVRCWRVSAGDLPPRTIPRPGVMLHAGLRPVIKRLTTQARASDQSVVVSFLTQAPVC